MKKNLAIPVKAVKRKKKEILLYECSVKNALILWDGGSNSLATWKKSCYTCKSGKKKEKRNSAVRVKMVKEK